MGGPWLGSRDALLANNVLYNRRNKFVHLGSANWSTLVRASVVGNTFIEGASQVAGPVSAHLPRDCAGRRHPAP